MCLGDFSPVISDFMFVCFDSLENTSQLPVSLTLLQDYSTAQKDLQRRQRPPKDDSIAQVDPSVS